ncbi:MAG: DNRLRE domain-containing protein [Opitutaceae bacterium]|jgi:hypothetical protein|nr:DNRLRE domain-containing protein [Opitutaceae bacterium]
MKFQSLLRALCVSVVNLLPLSAAGVALAPLADTYVRQDGGNTGYGLQKTIRVGQAGIPGSLMRGLVAFDISGIPAGAKVTSATLTLCQSAEDGIGDNSRMTVRLLPAALKVAEQGVTWNNSRQAEALPANAKILAAGELWVRPAPRGVKLPSALALSSPELAAHLQALRAAGAKRADFMLVNASENAASKLRAFVEFASLNAGNAATAPSLQAVFEPAN